MHSRGNVAWCNASDVWSSRENLILNTSIILLRRIVSQSVYSYHDWMMHMIALCNQPIIDIQPTLFVSLVHTNEPVLEIVIDFAGFCCCLVLFKPLFSYWKFAQCLAIVFIWSTCLITECLYRFRWVYSEHLFSYSCFAGFFRSSYSHIFLSCCFSEHLYIVLSGFFVAGAAVLI